MLIFNCIDFISFSFRQKVKIIWIFHFISLKNIHLVSFRFSFDHFQRCDAFFKYSHSNTLRNELCYSRCSYVCFCRHSYVCICVCCCRPSIMLASMLCFSFVCYRLHAAFLLNDRFSFVHSIRSRFRLNVYTQPLSSQRVL